MIYNKELQKKNNWDDGTNCSLLIRIYSHLLRNAVH